MTCRWAPPTRYALWRVTAIIMKDLSLMFPWPGDSEGIFLFLSQATTYPLVYHTQWRLHTVPLIAERQAGKL